MTGDRRSILEDQRDRLVRIIEDGVEPKDLAALSRELRLVLSDLEGLGGSKEDSVVDELRQRRAARMAGPETKTGSNP